MDFMQKKELHGQIPVVTPCSRQALNQFEMQARKGEMGLQNGGQLAYLAPYTNRVISLSFLRPEKPYLRRLINFVDFKLILAKLAASTVNLA